jgi:hypothetical protein
MYGAISGSIKVPARTQAAWLGRDALHASACVRMRGVGTSTSVALASGSLRAPVSIRQLASAYASLRQLTSAYVSLRQLTSAYVSLRQHTSAYVSIRQHT